ncbi:unnamed protein product [Linum trigynum]|uniref:Uncharacterized protein n=1 Tax=Linum trigynum TaxID=586398 RepID=A0AAV2DPH4_9ROSI
MGKIKVQAKLPHLDPRLADPAVYQVLKELLSDSTTNQFLELQMSIHLHKFLGSILERKLVLAGLGSSYSSMSVLRDPSAILQVAIKSVETSLKPLKQLAKAIKVHQNGEGNRSFERAAMEGLDF